MKSVTGIIGLVLAFQTGWAQMNHQTVQEKDTTVTTVINKSGSVQFHAEVMPDFIQLRWLKGPHDYIGYFELYRSPDGVAFHLVKQFHPESFDANDNSFEYRDENPLRGRNYYRLVGIDRTTQERKNVDIVADYKNQPRKIQPSLVTKGSQLYIQNYDGEELILWIYNSGGAPVVQNRIIQSSAVNIPETLSRGAYIYQLTNRKQMLVASGKFIMQ